MPPKEKSRWRRNQDLIEPPNPRSQGASRAPVETPGPWQGRPLGPLPQDGPRVPCPGAPGIQLGRPPPTRPAPSPPHSGHRAHGAAGRAQGSRARVATGGRLSASRTQPRLGVSGQDLGAFTHGFGTHPSPRERHPTNTAPRPARLTDHGPSVRPSQQL